MEISVDAVTAAKIGFASHRNAPPLLREVRIALSGEQALERCRLSLTAVPAFVEPRDWQIDRIVPGDELVIADCAVRLDAALLAGLTESLRGALTLALHAEDGTELARCRRDVEWLPHEEGDGLPSTDETPPAGGLPDDRGGGREGDRLRHWQRRLLNLTSANRLLHVPESAGTLRLLCPEPGLLSDRLASGQQVRILPMPAPETGEGGAAHALRRGAVLSPLPRDKLDAALADLGRKARADLEEGGADTLHLALGFLRWRKSGEERSCLAPLVLLPVRLERGDAPSGMAMAAQEDEPRLNMALLEGLRRDFGLAVGGLEEAWSVGNHGVDLDRIWGMVRSAVCEIPGFEVVPEVMLGTFSFAGYLMWKDLAGRRARLRESPLVRHLIERDGGGFGSRGDFPSGEGLDAAVNPGELYTLFPADKVRLAAVAASARGQSFVLDGPPGRGRSQTIANIIAHNMALGRRVLFVSERKAALDAVRGSLAEKGLAPFCLDLHPAAASAAVMLRQLDQARTTGEALAAGEWEREAAEARRLRGELNDLVHLLHRREDNGWTLHGAIGLALREGEGPAVRLGFEKGARHDGTAMERMRDIVRRLALARDAVSDLPGDLGGMEATGWSSGWQDEIAAAAAQIAPALDWVEDAAHRLLSLTLLPLVAADRSRLGRLADFVRLLMTMHGHDMRFAFSPLLPRQIRAAREALALIARYREEEAALSVPYGEDAVRRIDSVGALRAWSRAQGKFWPLSVLAKRRVATELARVAGSSGPVDAENDLPHLEAMPGLLERIDALAPFASALPGWAGLATHAEVMEAALARAERLRTALSAQADRPGCLADLRRAVERLVVDANDLLASDGLVAGALARLDRALADHDAATQDFARLGGIGGERDFAGWRALADAATTHAARLRDWADWRRVRGEAVGAGLLPLVEALERGEVEPSGADRAFELAYARWFISDRMEGKPLPGSFAAEEQGRAIARFHEVDERMSALASRYIRARICGFLADTGAAGEHRGYAVLERQLRRRGHKPIRELVAEMGGIFARLAPCMLMSPLSVARYLPDDLPLFDLVILEETSRITPWNAIGAMAWGRQVVIAGDTRRTPPSRDVPLGAMAGEEGGGERTEPDLPSIVRECLAAGVPRHSIGRSCCRPHAVRAGRRKGGRNG